MNICGNRAKFMVLKNGNKNSNFWSGTGFDISFHGRTLLSWKKNVPANSLNVSMLPSYIVHYTSHFEST